MPKDPIEMSRNGEYLETIENESQNATSDSQQEVIEILTDDEEDGRDSNPDRDSNTNNNEPFIIRDYNDDDDIQITGANTMSSGDRIPSRIRRRNDSRSFSESRNVRRRPNDDEDDIQIIDERPAERRLIPPVDMLPSLAPNGLRRRVQGIETPVGVFESYEDSSTAYSGSESERSNRYSEPPRQISTRSRRARRIRPPRSNEFVALDHFLLSQQLYHNLYGDWNGLEDLHNTDAVEGSVMARIERDNEHAVDQRLQNENIFNRAALKTKKDIAENEMSGYTNDIKPDLNICCDLCGIILGEGIPDNFKPNLYYNKDDNFKKFCEDYKVQAPWFCIKQCLPADVDLSKRVFVAKCGHVYCGRCVKNIGNRPSGRRKQNQKITIDNPLVYAPRKCTNSECNLTFRGKKSFTELYF